MRFTNRYTPDFRTFFEYYANIVYPNRHRSACGFYFLAALALALFFYLASRREYYWGVLIIGVMFVLAAVLLVLTPRLSAKLSLPKFPDPEKNVTEISFGDYIRVREAGYEINYQYADIADIAETPSTFVLLFGKSDRVIVRKDSFVDGDGCVAFASFLNTLLAIRADRENESPN